MITLYPFLIILRIAILEFIPYVWRLNLMTDLTLCLEGPLKPHHAPILFASASGIFEGRDLDVDWIEPSPDETGLNRLIQGDCDLAITRPLNLVSEFLTGTDIVGIASFFHTNSGVMFNTDNEDLTNPEDLAEIGAEVLCSDITPGRAGVLLQTMISESSTDADADDINFVIPENDPIETFYGNDHQAFITAGVNPEGVQMEQADFEVDFWFYDDYDIPANGDLIVATRQEVADSEPNEMQDFIHSLNDSVKVIEEDADRGRSVIQDQFSDILELPGAEALMYTSLTELTSNFSQDFQTYTAWGDFLTEHGDVGGFVDVDRLIDERFIPLDSVAF